MSWLSSIGEVLTNWSTTIATAIVDGLDRLISPRLVKLTEQPDGSFALLAPNRSEPGAATTVVYKDGMFSAAEVAPLLRGSRVEIQLAGSRFLFRVLELPAQATDFLEGIVRARIDRLSPWSASAAVFGCSAPQPIDDSQISTTIAVCPRPTVMGYVQAALAFHPAAIAVVTEASDNDNARIKVFEQKAHGMLKIPQLARALLVLLGITAGAAVLSLAAATYEAGEIDSQQADIGRQIWKVRSALQAGLSSRERGPLQQLEKRKHELPISSIVIEALSVVLPDHTYVTELHLLGSRLQIVGITQDAPSLIRLIEQSPSFARATFFAPTTRTPSDPGERFHIEATIRSPGAASQ
jgi:general secretion pathway protein L